MKRNANKTLIKDIIMAALSWVICAALINAIWGGSTGSVSATEAKLMGGFFAGIPFGWRWASKIMTAVTVKGVFIKLGISVVLGWFAIFVVILGDIISCIAYNASIKKSPAKPSRGM